MRPARFGQTLEVARSWDGGPAEPGEMLSVAWTVDPMRLTVVVEAPFHGDPAPPGPPGRTERLWEFEVAELFLVGPREDYLELELGPHGHHLALRLAGVRRVVRDDLPLGYTVSLVGTRWRGVAHMDRAELPDPIERANAFAVHGTGLQRRYLVAHPLGGPTPDFHRIGEFPSIGGQVHFRGESGTGS